MHHVSSHRGFTLVELAIVLVIIGLIVGGVLVGQDLIKAAQIRSVVSDIEKYNAATSTFREKYTGLPGDLLNIKAVQFGFNTTANDAARNGALGRGDGNGSFASCDGPLMPLGCETVLFWSDLSAARLIPFSSKLDSVTGVEQQSLTNAELADHILPKLRIRDTALIAVFSNGSTHFFGLGELNTIFAGSDLAFAEGAARGFTPLEAFSVDQKLDDGTPMTGNIISLERYMNSPDHAGSPTNCMDAAGEQYNTVTEILANTDACSISVRAAF